MHCYPSARPARRAASGCRYDGPATPECLPAAEGENFPRSTADFCPPRRHRTQLGNGFTDHRRRSSSSADVIRAMQASSIASGRCRLRCASPDRCPVMHRGDCIRKLLLHHAHGHHLRVYYFPVRRWNPPEICLLRLRSSNALRINRNDR